MLRLSTCVVVALPLLAASVALAEVEQSSDAPAVTVIRGGQLFDGTDHDVQANATIVITGDRITAIGGKFDPPAGATIIDASGMTILPGLIDLHVHFGAPAGDDLDKTQQQLMSEYIAQRPAVRQAFLAAGVTSIRSVGDVLGNPWWGIIGLQRAIEAGTMQGPRIFAAGPIFTAPNGHPVSTHYKGNPFLIVNAARQVTDPQKAREQVKLLANQGVHGIKAVYSDGGGRMPQLSLDVLEAIIDEAHQHNLWVAVHTGTNQNVQDAVAAGADTIEHGVSDGRPIEQATLALLKKHRVTYIPTLAVHEAIGGPRRKGVMITRSANVKAVFDAGIAIGAGTDTQGPNMSFGPSMHRELELLVEAGLTPAQALIAATRNAAAAMRMDKELGTIEPDKLADLILVAGDPTKNIADLANIRLVIQNGRVLIDKREAR